MLNEQEANDLVSKLFELRNKLNISNDKKIFNELKKHENLCMSKFKYLVMMRANKYKRYDNFEDLIQEGLEALVMALKNYNKDSGSFFWWAHKYIDTRISRKANTYSTIKYPLKFAKTHSLIKEKSVPNIIDNNNPEKCLESKQLKKSFEKAFQHLNAEQVSILQSSFGFEDDELSISKMCKKYNITRAKCVKALGDSLNIIRHNIQL